jgi:hypothetical protein
MIDRDVTSADFEVERAWKMIIELRASEEHFNTIKAQIRTLASGWLLAAFGAMGFLLTEKLSVELPTEVAILAVAFAASLGLMLLWVLDLLVYHRLLDASFVEALKLEEKYPQLPQVRRNMIASLQGGQSTNFQAWFYIGAITAPLLFSGILFLHWCLQFGIWAVIGAAVALATIIFAVGLFVKAKSPNPAVKRYSPIASCPLHPR